MMPLIGSAQTKRVQSITTYECGEFYNSVRWTYDQNNRLLCSVCQVEDDSKLQMDCSYDGESTITVDVNGNGYRDLSRAVVHLTQGRATAMEVYGVKVDAKTPDYNKVSGYTMAYDGDGRLTQIEGDYDTITMTWTGGNPTLQHGEEKDPTDDYSWDLEFEYTTTPRPVLFPFYFEILEDFVEYELVYPHFYFPQYFGVMPSNLLAKMTMNEKEDNKLRTRVYDFSYVFDNDGDVTEVIVNREDSPEERIHYYIIYEGTTSIAKTTYQTNNIMRIYDVSGRQLPLLIKGLNIVRQENGKMAKVVNK